MLSISPVCSDPPSCSPTQADTDRLCTAGRRSLQTSPALSVLPPSPDSLHARFSAAETLSPGLQHGPLRDPPSARRLPKDNTRPSVYSGHSPAIRGAGQRTRQTMSSPVLCQCCQSNRLRIFRLALHRLASPRHALACAGPAYLQHPRLVILPILQILESSIQYTQRLHEMRQSSLSLLVEMIVTIGSREP
jgi:hypothetical protein